MKWLQESLSLIETIPPTFWGVVLGSMLSLGGVMLTNRANDRRLRAQLISDRELRAKERELALKKDIYLTATEAIAAAMRSIGSLSDMNLSNDEALRGYVEKSPAIAKVHVIASEETLRAVANISGELTAAFFHLISKRMPLFAMKEQITSLDQQIIAASKERDRMLELMTEHNIEGRSDARRFTTLQTNFEFQQNQIQCDIYQRDNIRIKFYRNQIILSEEALDLSNRVAGLAVNAVTAVRRELELPIDEGMYLKLTDELRQKQRADASRFVTEVSVELDKAEQRVANSAPPGVVSREAAATGGGTNS